MTKSILIVEDDAALRGLLGELLETQGYHITTSGSALDALQLLEQNGWKPDMILSDMSMNHMDGYQFYEVLRNDRRWHHIPFVLLTGVRLSREQLAECKYYIAKPFDAGVVIEFVNEVLHQSPQVG